MKKPDNYDNIEPINNGGFEQLPPGAYNCIIKAAYEIKSQSGKTMLQLLLDVADGEYKDYFFNQFNSMGKKYGDVKWRGTYNQLTEGDSLGYFKGLIQDIQDSNPGYIFNFDEKTLTGKKIGGVFGREQYKNNLGELKFAIKCFYCTNISKIKDIQPPKDKLLEQNKTVNSYGGTPASDGMTPLNVESDLPF